MEQLSVAGDFDVHDHRHQLKLLEETREAMVLANRDELGCPACGEIFERLYVTDDRTARFGDLDGAFCVARADDALLVLVH